MEVTGFAVTGVSYNFINTSWHALNMTKYGVVLYQVSISNGSSIVATHDVLSNQSLMYQFSNLNYNTLYNVSVKAKNLAGFGKSKSIINQKTYFGKYTNCQY